MSSKDFQTVLAKSGSKTFLEIPFDPDLAWGKKDRHHVTGTINGFKYRGEVASEGGIHQLKVGPAWLRDTGLKAGDEVAVVLDAEGPQVGRVAEDIATALEANPQARAFFESLPTFYRKNYMRWIESAKRPETRQARITESIQLLAAGKRER